MALFKRILVIVDLDSEESAPNHPPSLIRAAQLAEHLDCSLELFSCGYDPYFSEMRVFDPTGVDEKRKELLSDHVDLLEKLAQKYRDKGLTVDIDARWEHPLDEAILAKVAENESVLVVKDTQFHSATRQSIFSNVDWSLMRHCPQPLLLTKPRSVGASPTILAAVDPVHSHDKPAKLDHAIVIAAQEVAEAVGGALHLFHSFDPMPTVSAATRWSPPLQVDVDKRVEEERQRHRGSMEELLSRYSITEDRVHFHEGPPHDQLVGAAIQESVDIVVMGSVSRGMLKRAVVGSTAERVLDRIPSDLLLIKPPPSDGDAGGG
ncbi:MAG: universal stress protein [Gammaproteobacteria bacterium]